MPLKVEKDQSTNTFYLVACLYYMLLYKSKEKQKGVTMAEVIIEVYNPENNTVLYQKTFEGSDSYSFLFLFTLI